MTYDFNQARATAKRVISKFGNPGQVVLKGAKGGFDANGDVTADVADQSFDGIITPLVQFKLNEIDGKSIISGDSWVLWQGDDALAVDMQITINSTTFRIKGMQDLSSTDGINIYIKLQLRK